MNFFLHGEIISNYLSDGQSRWTKAGISFVSSVLLRLYHWPRPDPMQSLRRDSFCVKNTNFHRILLVPCDSNKPTLIFSLDSQNEYIFGRISPPDPLNGSRV